MTKDEKYKIVVECRLSGLSDKAWCALHNINDNTFAVWAHRLRKDGYDVPKSVNPNSHNRTNCTFVSEKYKIVCDCRTSGMTARSWCTERDINPSTFYEWVHLLKQQGYYVPDQIRPCKPSTEVSYSL